MDHALVDDPTPGAKPGAKPGASPGASLGASLGANLGANLGATGRPAPRLVRRASAPRLRVRGGRQHVRAAAAAVSSQAHRPDPTAGPMPSLAVVAARLVAVARAPAAVVARQVAGHRPPADPSVRARPATAASTRGEPAASLVGRRRHPRRSLEPHLALRWFGAAPTWGSGLYRRRCSASMAA